MTDLESSVPSLLIYFYFYIYTIFDLLPVNIVRFVVYFTLSI